MRKAVLVLCSLLVLGVFMIGCGADEKEQGRAPGNKAGELEAIALNALKEYFQIAIDFSEGEFDSDEVYKKQLKARYRKIFTGPLLEEFYRFVDDGSIESDYFLSAFSPEVNCKIKEIRILNSSENTLEAEAVVNNDYEFSAIADDFESPTFVKDNKVSGMTQDKFSQLIREYNPIGITSAQVKKYSFVLVKDGEVWKFKKLDQQVEETKLLELQGWDGQKVTL